MSPRITPERVLEVLSRRDRPVMRAREIQRALGARGHETRAVRAALRELEERGEVERQAGGWRRPRRDRLVEGVFSPASGRARRGGTVVDDAGTVWSVPDAGGAEGGERVVVQPLEPRRRGRAELVGVLEGGREDWVGILERGRGARGHVVRPFRDAADWRVQVPPGETGGAADGEVVVVAPLRPGRAPSGANVPTGRVVERLGPPDAPDARFRAVVWRRRLRVAFPAEVLAEAEIPSAGLDAAELERRVDLRDRLFCTIDPASARDHDDAVCVEREGEGARLWVAIADVSHFVAPSSALDHEALRRGNSVYFPDRAIPMLPERLSGDLCSLRPDVDRLALVVEILFDARARPRRRSFYPAVIRSRARLDYATAAKAMEAGAAAGVPEALVSSLRALAALAERLTRRRLAGGAIDFALPEALVQLDAEGRPVDIRVAERTLAHRAIEEAMLAANRAVASAIEAGGVPSVYRIHEPPAPSEIEELRELLGDFGLLERGGGELGPAEIARALQRVIGRPEERLVRTAALRAMKQARYDARNRGHFALAFDSYCHFTSPIRRYADLVVHRALRALLADGAQRGDPRRSGEERMRRVAARVSWRERVAVEAEREMHDLVKCAFMQRHLGEEFDGTVTGVARHGLYVTLDPVFVEGLVPVARLRGFFEHDERAHALVERRTGRRHHLGDRVRVRVARVDLVRAWLDFDLLEPEGPPRGEGPRAPRSGGPARGRPRAGRAGRGRDRARRKQRGRRRGRRSATG